MKKASYRYLYTQSLANDVGLLVRVIGADGWQGPSCCRCSSCSSCGSCCLLLPLLLARGTCSATE